MIIQGYGGGKDDARTPNIEPEGIYVVLPGTNQTSLAISKNQVEVLDLLCEGEVQGIVSGYNRYHGGYIGRTGWSEVEFIPFNDGVLSGTNINSGVLRSVFYNGTPILDSSSKYNFSNIQFKFVNGTPNGATGIGSESIFDDEVTITKPIGEQLLGPNFTFSEKGQPIPSLGNGRKDKYRGNYDALLETDPDAANQNKKVYRFYDRDIVGFNVNLRIQSLNFQEVENIKKYGDSLSYNFDAIIKVRQIYKNVDVENLLLYTRERQVGLVGRVATSSFLHTERIDLDDNSDNPNFQGWEVEIIRKTADSVHPAVSCGATVDSITQIYSQTYRYPHSVLASHLFDAEFFANIPDTSYLINLMKIKVPSNYDPIKKSYDGDWDGTFKDVKEWSNNPAWVYYDMMTNKRYGLGNYIDEDFVDKWSLYEVGQYCDQLVRDGYSAAESPSSGLEPRFEANLLLNTQEEAYDVMNNLASIFRGMTYYLAGNIDVSQDAPKDPRVVFTNANVKDGNFVYSSSSQKSRNTVALVRYNDKLNNYESTLEYVEDPEGIRKYGINQTDVTAIGCTSRGQAFRLGRWLLATERLEPETVSFQAGIGEASMLRPGDIIKIFDENKTKKRYSGRTLKTEIYAYPNDSGAKILVDRQLPIHNWETYKFSIATPTYNYEPSLINTDSNFTSADLSGINRGMIQEVYFTGGPTTVTHTNGLTEITFTGESYTGFGMSQFNTGSYEISNNLIFAIEKSGVTEEDCEYQLYKTISVKEEDPVLYSVFATYHNPAKYDIIETGLSFGKDVTEFQEVGAPTIKNFIPIEDNNCLVNFIVTKGSNTKYILFYVGKNLPDRVYSTSVAPTSSIEAVYTVGEDTDDVLITYRMENSSTYDFAFWATDGISMSSNGAVYSSQFNNGNPIETTNCLTTICGINVSSLRSEGLSTVNDPASRQTVSVSDPEPTFSWNLDYDLPALNFNSNIRTRTYFEMSAPKDSDSLDGREIYGSKLGDNAEKTEYKLTIEENIELSRNADVPGPYRDYDLIVSLNETARSRFSGTVWSKFSKDCNPFGYDIIGVTNPIPERVTVTSFNPIVASNELTLDFSNFNIFTPGRSDYRGFAVFHSWQNFSISDIQDLNSEVGRDIRVASRFFEEESDLNEPIKILAARSDTSNLDIFKYAAIVILDEFDFKVSDVLSESEYEVYLRQKVATSSRITSIKQLISDE